MKSKTCSKTYNPSYSVGALSAFSQKFRLLNNSGNFPCQLSEKAFLFYSFQLAIPRDVTIMVKEDNKAEMELCANGAVTSALTVGMEKVEYGMASICSENFRLIRALKFERFNQKRLR